MQRAMREDTAVDVDRYLAASLLDALRRDGHEPVDSTVEVRWLGRDDLVVEPGEDNPFDRAVWNGDAFIALVSVDVADPHPGGVHQP